MRLWRTRNPRTFRDKVRYKMLRDHRPLVVTFADKAAVRGYVADVVGDRYLPRVYAILDDPAGLCDVDLPAAYVVKPTHGSGAAIVVSDGASPAAQLPTEPGNWSYSHVRSSAAHRAEVVRLAEGWMAQLYGQGPNREWVYGQIPRRVIIEELLTDTEGEIPDDHKLFVFHGVCRFVQVDRGRFGSRTQDFFTAQWKHLGLRGSAPCADVEPSRAGLLAEMICVAEKLGEETDFVRIDLYDTGERIVVGELTSFPAGGDSPFDPESFDVEFGRPWTVPRRY